METEVDESQKLIGNVRPARSRTRMLVSQESILYHERKKM